MFKKNLESINSHPEFVKSLLKYIVVEPDDLDTDFKRCYKYLTLLGLFKNIAGKQFFIKN